MANKISRKDWNEELRADLSTYLENIERPIIHRLKFDQTSIYLTQAEFYDVNVSTNEMGHYRIFSWTDWRAKGLLGYELGEESPNLGVANLIGRYLPHEEDLTDVQYASSNGKAYFE